MDRRGDSIQIKKSETDLVKAYETIYRKSREPHMKNMARKFLEDCGYFKTKNKDKNDAKKENRPASVLENKKPPSNFNINNERSI